MALKPCPKCKQYISDYAEKCPYCGITIENVETNHGLQCPGCGEFVSAVQATCNVCGYKLPERSAHQAETETIRAKIEELQNELYGTPGPKDEYGYRPPDRRNIAPDIKMPDDQVYLNSHMPIHTYYAESILALLLCCIPFAIPALIYASQARERLAEGLFVEAKRNAEKARMWLWISVGVALIAGLIRLCFYIAGDKH